MRKLPRSLCLALLSAVAILFPHAALAQANSRQTASAGTLVFVVGGDVEEKSLDALVVVNSRGQLTQPYADQDMEAARRFAEAHFRVGQKYRLTFGGGDAGSLTVKAAGEGCNNFHANGTAETTANIRGRVMALATDSETFGRGASARRAPDAKERAAALELVSRIYRQRKTPASLLSKIEVTNLTATDLDRDGRYEMVGSFTLASKPNHRRDLFLIAAPQATGFRADFVHFQSYQLPSEGFDSSVDFVDQLDMDGDGVGEVVTIDGGFDAYGYSIYRKRRGRWTRVYQVTGDAC